MKQLNELLLNSQLTKNELKKIRGGIQCMCRCMHGSGEWLNYTLHIDCKDGPDKPLLEMQMCGGESFSCRQV